jgi:hypothetical protein
MIGASEKSSKVMRFIVMSTNEIHTFLFIFFFNLSARIRLEQKELAKIPYSRQAWLVKKAKQKAAREDFNSGFFISLRMFG